MGETIRLQREELFLLKSEIDTLRVTVKNTETAPSDEVANLRLEMKKLRVMFAIVFALFHVKLCLQLHVYRIVSFEGLI